MDPTTQSVQAFEIVISVVEGVLVVAVIALTLWLLRRAIARVRSTGRDLGGPGHEPPHAAGS